MLRKKLIKGQHGWRQRIAQLKRGLSCQKTNKINVK